MPRIFISYRRGDSAGHAGRIYDHLIAHFGQGQVFMDVDAIRPGVDFVEVVQEAIGASDCLIAVIGTEWLTASDSTEIGGRRLEDPDDMVRLEIATALERGIPVIPVLVQGAQMPRGNDLPDVLKPLASRNALEVSDTRFRSDVDRLIETLEAPTQDRLADTVFAEPAQLATSTFVGRDREMGELNTALEETLAGQSRLVMLVGEPGIGKTRTAQELASRAERRGAQVLWGRCYEEEGAPPYWPWVQPIRSYVQQCDLDQLRSETGAGAAAVAEIVPELRQKLPGMESLPALEPEQARFRLFDSITSFLKNAAQSRPTMLVLDDLHWADKPSLLLLQFLAQEMAGSRLLVVGTYRDVELSRQHPLSETLAQLSRSATGGFQRVLLRGLDQEDTAQLIETSAGIEPTAGLVEALYSHTEGNPFFMTEVIKLLSESGELTADHIGTPEGLRIPEGVREVIGQRLNRLSQQCNEVLTTASVIGREFDFRLLNILSGGMSEDQLLQAVDEAVSVHLIEDVPGQMERYQFSHALIQQTLAEEVTTSRGVRLHARIGEALEDLYGDNVEPHAAELAHHFSEAATVTGHEKLVRYSIIAGERAMATYAHEEALAHFQRGLAAKNIAQPGTEPASDGEAAALLFGFGRAQGSTGQLVDAWETLGCAFDYYAEAGDVAMAVAVAEYPLLYVSDLPSAAHMVEQALSLVTPDSHEAGRLLSRYGLLVNLEAGDYQRASEAFDRALAIAEREGDAALEMRTLANSADADWYQLRSQEVMRKSLRAIELARRTNDPRTEAWPRFLASHESIVAGDLAAAGDHAQEMLAQTERLQDSGLLALACLAAANVFRLKGDWLSARDLLDRGLDLEPRNCWILSCLALIDYETGEFVQGKTYVERVLDIMRATTPGPTAEFYFPAWIMPVIARISGVMDGFGIAREAAQAVLSSPIHTPMSGTLRVGHAIIAVQQNDVTEAKERYDELMPWQHDVATYNISVGMPTIHRVLGLLATTIGQLDQSMVHFEDALTCCRDPGFQPELAWTCCDYADTLRERNDDGDRAKAMTLLDESLAISTELGMRPLMERVLTRREILGA